MKLDLHLTLTPAYFALVDCVSAIADQHGDDCAIEWVERVLGADSELFIRIDTDRRPQLKMIRGGLE